MMDVQAALRHQITKWSVRKQLKVDDGSDSAQQQESNEKCGKHVQRYVPPKLELPQMMAEVDAV